MMKKYLALLSCLLACAAVPCPAQTAGRAAQIVAQLSAEFRSMRSYGVDFEVAAGEQLLRGNYAVAGTKYYLRVGDAEVFSDGVTRYEVDNRRREVTLTSADTLSRNLLNNPVRAFDFLGDQYAAKLLWEREGRAAVRLTPAAGALTAGEITVTVTLSPVRPRTLVYDYDGEQATVTVGAVGPLATPLKSFDKTAFAGYEFIDFR